MALTFYFAPMSTAELVNAVIAELGVAHERVTLDLQAGDTRKPAFLAVNPNGRVPVIVHDGTIIWESAAITLYLGETFGVAAGLYPASGPQRGEAMKWIVWSNVTLAEAGGRLAASLPTPGSGAVEPGSQDWVPPDQRIVAAAERARADLAAGLAVLDGGLADRPFLLGEYSLVDTHVHSIVGWLTTMGTDLAPFANVGGWMSRCGARPAIARLYAG